MKHTPEPWYFHKRHIGFAITTKPEPGNPKWDIAIVYEEPDARLIAAAPELLEALRDLIICLEYGISTEAITSTKNGVFEKAQALIAKIEEVEG